MIYKEMKYDLEEMIYLSSLKQSRSPQARSSIESNVIEDSMDPKFY